MKHIRETTKKNSSSPPSDLVLYFLASLLILISNIEVAEAISRCEYVCSADDRCRNGECVLTYCVDTPYCFKFCSLCSLTTTCQQAGEYCYLFDQNSATQHTFRTNHSILIIGSFLLSCLNF